MTLHDARIPVPRSEELRADVSELLPFFPPSRTRDRGSMAVLARQPCSGGAGR